MEPIIAFGFRSALYYGSLSILLSGFPRTLSDMKNNMLYASRTHRHWFTLPETNIAPENGWLEYYFPIGEAYFQELC